MISPLQLGETVTRLPSIYAGAILLAFAAAIIIHFVRRSYHQPTRVGGAPVEIPGGSVKVFGLVQRLYHWSLFMVLGLMIVSGVALYSPGSFNYVLGAFGVAGTSAAAEEENLLWHTDMTFLLLGLIVIHLIYDLAIDRGWSHQLPRRYDLSDTVVRVKSFLGLGPKIQPRHGKYDIFMKVWHWGLVGCLVFLGVTGIYMWNPYGLLPTLSPGFESILRILHDLFAFFLIGLLAMHIYFAIEPVNWPVLRSMIEGTITDKAYNHDYDSKKWPLVKAKKANAQSPPAAAPHMAPTPTSALVLREEEQSMISSSEREV